MIMKKGGSFVQERVVKSSETGRGKEKWHLNMPSLLFVHLNCADWISLAIIFQLHGDLDKNQTNQGN